MNLKKLHTEKTFNLKNLSTSSIAWLLFEHTGEIGYYLMYRELSGKLEQKNILEKKEATR